MAREGIEPTRYCYHGILSPARLPVPPSGLLTTACAYRPNSELGLIASALFVSKFYTNFGQLQSDRVIIHGLGLLLYTLVMSQIIAVYKPKGPTSHDVVNTVRRITGERRVGHAGTLDPLASGVLVVGIGREATKQLALIVAKEKEYVAKICLGMTSTTDDEEGEKKVMTNKPIHINEQMIENTLQTFTGEISQTPPLYSAVKVKGKEAYKLARKGKEVILEPRKVLVKSIEIIDYNYPTLQIRAVTGPGVYIRSLARDIGEKLGVGGYLAELERTRVGQFTRENALNLEELAQRWPEML